MKKATLFVSMIVHGGVAVALLTASQHRASGKNFFVQMTEAKKKELADKPHKALPPKPKIAKVTRLSPRPRQPPSRRHSPRPSCPSRPSRWTSP